MRPFSSARSLPVPSCRKSLAQIVVEIASGPASRTDLAVRVVRGRIPFIPPLAGAASRFV